MTHRLTVHPTWDGTGDTPPRRAVAQLRGDLDYDSGDELLLLLTITGTTAHFDSATDRARSNPGGS